MRQLYYVIRTLIRGRGSNVIKIISLGLGLAMSILLFARVAFEQSFDTCFRDTDNLYQVYSVWTQKGERSEPYSQNMGPVAGAILENFPKEVEAATSVCRYTAGDPLFNGSVRFDEGKVMADSLFFRTMGIEVLTGDQRELIQKDVVFLSDRFARKIFGEDNPIGKTLMFGKQFPLTVKGTYAALPENTTMVGNNGICEAVISMPTMWSRNWSNYSWNGGDSYFEYIRFRPEADKESVMRRLDAMVAKYLPAEMEQIQLGYTAVVKPIRDEYRTSDAVQRMTKIMTLLGFAILFIATLNYVLISISSLAYRAKAVGVHKCSGASGQTVFYMFLLETGIIILLALLLAGLLLVNFSDFVEDMLVARLSSLFSPERLWVPVGTVLLLFVIGGIVPGRIFSRIPVSQVFRRYSEGKKGWKRPLLFVQFMGVAFIAGLMCIVMAQYNYVLHKDTGYQPERMVTTDIGFDSAEASDYAQTFFKNLPYVEAVSAASNNPTIGLSGAIVNEGGKSLFSTRFMGAMDSYPSMMGITFKQGRMPRDRSEIAVNETFVRLMHWDGNVLGRVVGLDGSGEGSTVVGVLKDFHTGSFYTEQQPLAMYYKQRFGSCIHLRLKEPFEENLRQLNKDVAATFSDKLIDFSSMEQDIKESYNAVRVFRNGTLVAAITMLFVMLMGLIGYTADEVRRRSKEIAVRKVNGAESAMILRLLSVDVLYVALPAVIIGTLASWYVNDMWMELFAEKVTVSWAMYILTAVGILAIIVGCVVLKSWRIANENPVKSLKSE
ncbi:ABC transporter permease [Bacteroides sp.]|uniref:ABC transporter permease n=1 Tax=Bacteroides sp. TaxID=29523 RepID=UPI002FCC8855